MKRARGGHISTSEENVSKAHGICIVFGVPGEGLSFEREHFPRTFGRVPRIFPGTASLKERGMRIHKIACLAGLLGLAACLVVTPLRSSAQDDTDGVEVLARGPLHEAFATPLDSQPTASPIVPKEPPEPIEEQPPEQKPEGDNVGWVPGYWAWDADDFLWVSGFWRDIPPSRRWIPGTWQKVSDEGWRWGNGFWAHEEQEEVLYVPPPPETLERGPSTEAPEVSSDYVPGCWIWRETRHVWRPGYWLAHRADWTWAPTHYVWTPAGCVFVEGYWDHPLHERGLLFAPIRVERRLLVRNFSYQPRYVVPADALLGALFVRKETRQYHFGDYFGARDQRAGYVSWLDYRPARNVADANFSYYRAENVRDRRWEPSLRGLYTARQKGEVASPPRTLVQQTTVIQNLTVQKTQNVTVNKTINLTNINNVTMLAPLTKIENTRVTALAGLAQPSGTPVKEVETKKVVKLQTVSVEQRKQVKEHTTQLREVAVQRKQIEEKGKVSTTPVKPSDPPRNVKLALPKAPLAPPPPRETRPPQKTVPPLPPQVPKFDPKPKGPPTTPIIPPKKEDPKPIKDKPIRDGDKPKTPPPPLPKVEPPPPPKVVTPPPPPPKVVIPPPPKVTPPPPPPPPKVVPPPPPPPPPKVVPPPPKGTPPKNEKKDEK